jgi:hypothetical protein
MRITLLALALGISLTTVSLASAQTAPPSDVATADPSAPAAATGPAALMRSSTILSPGILGSFGGGRTTDFAIGAQLRLDYYPTALPIRMGGWITGEVLGDSAVRAAGGLTGGMWIFDCQLGLAYRSATDRFAGSLGLVIGKTINFGWVSVGARLTIPLVDFTSPNGAQQTQGIEGTLVLTFSMPTTLDGDARNPLDCPRQAIRDACPCHRHPVDAGATPPTQTAPTTTPAS